MFPFPMGGLTKFVRIRLKKTRDPYTYDDDHAVLPTSVRISNMPETIRAGGRSLFASSLVERGTPFTKPIAGSIVFMAALSSSSSTVTSNQSGSETTSVAVLTIPDTTLDIRVGDMIRTVPDDGRRWKVRGFPSKDVNPFTSWQPTIEATLEEVRGV